MKFIYKPLLRPASSMTLPKGDWRYAELPAFVLRNPNNLPISKHPFGLIAFDRKLTDAEIETYDLERVK